MRDEHLGARPRRRRLEELRTECRETRISGLLAEGRVSPALVEASSCTPSTRCASARCWLHAARALPRRAARPRRSRSYRRYAERLDDDLGLDPGAELRDLQARDAATGPALGGVAAAPQLEGRTQLQTPSTPRDRRRRSRRREPATPAARIDARRPRARDRDHRPARWTTSRTGTCAGSILTGPAGIGKSRLAEECCARMRSRRGARGLGALPEEDGVAGVVADPPDRPRARW